MPQILFTGTVFRRYRSACLGTENELRTLVPKPSHREEGEDVDGEEGFCCPAARATKNDTCAKENQESSGKNKLYLDRGKPYAFVEVQPASDTKTGREGIRLQRL